MPVHVTDWHISQKCIQCTWLWFVHSIIHNIDRISACIVCFIRVFKYIIVTRYGCAECAFGICPIAKIDTANIIYIIVYMLLLAFVTVISHMDIHGKLQYYNLKALAYMWHISYMANSSIACIIILILCCWRISPVRNLL